MSHTFRKAAAVSALALAALAAGASSAQADIEKNLEYNCKYPLVDKKPLSLNIKSNIPTYAKLNEQQPPFDVVVEATAKDGTSQALDTLDAYKLTGTSEARVSLLFPSGFVQGNLKVLLTVDPFIRLPGTPLPDPLVLGARGKTPSVNFDELGKTDIRLDKIALNLAAFYDDGSPINVKKLSTDFDGNPVTDSDANPNTFDVYCKPEVNQSPIIATVEVTETGLPGGGGGCSDVIALTPANCPPSRVDGLKVDSVLPSSVKISWNAVTDPDAGGAISYNVYQNGVKVDTVTGTSYTATGLAGDTTYAFDVEATDGNTTSAKTTISATTTHNDINLPPTVPTGLKAGTVGPTSIPLSWNASTDPDDAVKGYNVYKDGVKVGFVVGTSFTVNGLLSFMQYSFAVEAVDTRDAVSPRSAVLKVNTGGGDDFPPTAPTGVKPTTVDYNRVALAWIASIDDIGVAGYNVYRGGVKINSSLLTGTTFIDATVLEQTVYSYEIEAIDTGGNRAKSQELQVTTPPHGDPICPQGFACYDYGLKGSTSLKTLTKGNLPLFGGIKAQLDVSNGKFTADLTLNNTSGRLTAAGFLPITAKVGFVPVGKTTGQLDDATATKPQSITTNSKVRIKVLEVKLFGAIPLAGGNNCQTKSLSDINLKSTNAFDPLKGGTIGGTYAISDLNGCGALNGLVSPLTAGGGNTITLDLTKKG